MPKFTHCFVIVFALSFLSVDAQQLIRGPYLQNPTPQAVVLCWRTDVPTQSRVSYGEHLQNLDKSVLDSALVTEHFVRLDSLAPYTRYYYQIGTDSMFFEADSNQYVRTFPEVGSVQPVSVWVLGDFGKGTEDQIAVRKSFESFDAEHKTDVWLWLGDNAYETGKDSEYQSKVFDTLYGYHELMKRLPFHPAPGNHDYGSVTASLPPLQHSGPYFDLIRVPQSGEAGGVPSHTALYYSFDYANIHFVSLNSELASFERQEDDWIGANPNWNFTASPMTAWLRADLKANRQPWCVVYFHQPPYTDGSHSSASMWEYNMQAMRKHFVPIFEEFGVDLVLSGHSHVYERSYLLHGFYGNNSSFNPAQMLVNGTKGSLGSPYRKYWETEKPNLGTVYVVAGNGGAKAYSPPALRQPGIYYGDGCDSCLGSFLIDVHADTLRGRYLSASGIIKDEFYMLKSAKPVKVPSVKPFFELYPNPVTQDLMLVRSDNNGSRDWYLSVYDECGELVLGEQLLPPKPQVEVQTKAWAAGVYVLVFRDESGQYMHEKIIKR